ncbi:MAG: hypothetical protein ACOYXT_22060 [Bacteroidota bacterium]
MTSIKINKPFSFSIDILESEDVLPSLKLWLNCALPSFGKKTLEINNEAWIACRDWDKFIDNLFKIMTRELDESILEDLSGNILIKISRIKEQYFLNFYFNKVGALGVGAKCEVNGLIEKDELSNIIEKLNDFDKWW